MKRLLWAAALAAAVPLLPRPLPAEQPPLPGSPEAKAMELVNRMGKGEFAAAVKQFDGRLGAALPAGKMQKAWGELEAQVGRFVAIDGVRTEKGREGEVVFVLCEFEGSGINCKVSFDAAGKVRELYFITPSVIPGQATAAEAMPALFEERAVTVGASPWALPGTLSIPASGFPCPAVVLVHDFGPRDRDESIRSNKPFRDLAWGLASRGVAVLRYEKRTRQHARMIESLDEGITIKEEVVDDALAAVALLRTVKEIDPKRIFILGHGFGGMIAPRIASQDKGVAGLIILGGMSRPLEDVILDRTRYFVSLRGTPSPGDVAVASRLAREAARVKEPGLSSATPPEELPLGLSPAYWLALRGYHAPEEARKLNRPILVLQGGRDYEATMEDFEGWRKGLSGRPNASFKNYPALNHLFVSGQGKSTPQEYFSLRRMDTFALDDIASWVKKH